MEEEWRDVPGYEEYYQVSNRGRVKCKKRIVLRVGVVGRAVYRERIKYQQVNKKCNYWETLFCVNGYRQTVKIHRLVAHAFLPNPNNFPEVNHIDCNRLNNRVENLEWVTKKDNVIHAGKNGRMSRKGEQNGAYKHGKYVQEKQAIQV